MVSMRGMPEAVFAELSCHDLAVADVVTASKGSHLPRQRLLHPWKAWKERKFFPCLIASPRCCMPLAESLQDRL